MTRANRFFHCQETEGRECRFEGGQRAIAKGTEETKGEWPHGIYGRTSGSPSQASYVGEGGVKRTENILMLLCGTDAECHNAFTPRRLNAFCV